MTDGASSKSCNVTVVCRFRPLNALEAKTGSSQPCVLFHDDNKGLEITGESSDSSENHTRAFTFDRTFAPTATQKDVYVSTALPQVKEALAGYNCTIFAYGQTGSGKTHTMMGPSGGDLAVDANLRGIIPRISEDLFSALLSADADTEFTLRVSFMEIYMERLRDLLLPTPARGKALRIREDRARGIYVDGATEEYVSSPGEMMDLMRRGSANRAIASTRMNQDSSRSHSVFTIKIGQKNLRTQVSRNSKLVLIDLAGSEMVKKTKAQGSTLKEAKMINKSLSALGNVIKALVERTPHVPYRDSKLTRLLQDSLGGNSKTALIIACSSSEYNVVETLSTLRFGTRAKSIKNKPIVNEEFTVAEYKVMLAKANKMIETLRSGKGANEDASGASKNTDRELADARARIEHLEAEIEDRDAELAVTKEAVSGHLLKISGLEQAKLASEQAARALKQSMDANMLKLKQKEFQLNEIALGKMADASPSEIISGTPSSPTKLSLLTDNMLHSPCFSDDESDGTNSQPTTPSGVNSMDSSPSSHQLQYQDDLAALTQQTVDLRMKLMLAREELDNVGNATTKDLMKKLRKANTALEKATSERRRMEKKLNTVEHENRITNLKLLNRDDHIAFLETAMKSQQEEFKRVMQRIDSEYAEKSKRARFLQVCSQQS